VLMIIVTNSRLQGNSRLVSSGGTWIIPARTTFVFFIFRFAFCSFSLFHSFLSVVSNISDLTPGLGVQRSGFIL
jgi:hypothetical protein